MDNMDSKETIVIDYKNDSKARINDNLRMIREEGVSERSVRILIITDTEKDVVITVSFSFNYDSKYNDIYKMYCVLGENVKLKHALDYLIRCELDDNTARVLCDAGYCDVGFFDVPEIYKIAKYIVDIVNDE